MSGVRIETAIVADEELVEAFQRLLPLLSKSATPLEAYDLESIVASPATTLFVARDSDNQIVGTLTLVLFRSPSGARGWIEDVIVDEAARGNGVGEALVDAAIDLARRSNARTLDLTSNPTREAANRLYVRCGFEQRTTNVYRFSLHG
ncbi:MAG: GNAT family N-acetyltransferase [Actinomycetes bacterium]